MSLAYQARRLLRELARQGGRALPADTWAGDRARRLLAPFVPRVPLAPAEKRARVAAEYFLQDPRAVLAFPAPRSPAVSIAMALNGRLDCAYRCLESLSSQGTDDCELIVVSRGSSDGAADLLGRLRNAVVLEGDSTQGAAGAWNQAAERARSRCLLLLDSCWAPASGSVAAMRETLEAQSACGSVTGPLVRADGTLYEAGAIVWSDGALLHHGHRGDVAEAQFSYLREVDCGAASFQMVRRDLFLQAGGCDAVLGGDPELLGPDLGMAIRRLGHRVVYEPRAAAFHCGHPGSRSDPAFRPAGTSRVFVEKWRRELQQQPERRKVSVLRAQDRACGPRVLVVDDRIPDASQGAGFPRAHALVTMLASLGYRVTLFPYRDKSRYEPWLHDLQRGGIEVMAGAMEFPAFAAARAGFYDVVIASRPPIFRAVCQPVRRLFPRAAVIYDAEALFFMRDKLKARLAGQAWSEEGAEREERALLRLADVVVAVSEEEKAIMVADAPELEPRIRIWSHPVKASPTTTPFRDRRGLLFVGAFPASESPNEDAVRWFLREVLPLVRSHVDCRLSIAGFGAAEALGDAAAEDADVLGYQSDLTARYESCRVFVVPHLYAAGIPLKLCESMARGIPAVVTDLVARQLGVEPGREVLVGRTAGEFADRVVELYESEPRWNSLREKGLAFVRERHEPARLRADLDDLIKSALAAVRDGTAGSR